MKASVFKSLYFQVLTAITLGVLLGHFYPELGAQMKPLGDGFVKLIKMIIAPVIFCTVVTGIAGMESMKAVGRTGAIALLYFEIVSTIALLIAIMIFSKRDDARAVAKLSLPMGCFNINEPVIFGLPIVLNPIYFIPWLITPVILATIAYLATASGLIPPVFITVPWVVPPVIYAILATGGSLMAGVIAAINLVVAVLCWIPFVIVANRMNNVEE